MKPKLESEAVIAERQRCAGIISNMAGRIEVISRASSGTKEETRWTWREVKTMLEQLAESVSNPPPVEGEGV